MEWTADVTAGEWIRERLDAVWTGSMHGVVPRGFPAYARILHPATRSRPVGRDWPPLPYEQNVRAWEAFGRDEVEIDTEAIRWADAADAFGTTLHPLVQWGALVRAHLDGPGEWQQVQAPDGWQYDAPMEGALDAESVAIIAEHLAAATATPDGGFVALWEGDGALLGHMGVNPSRSFFAIGSSDPRGDAPTGAATTTPRDAAEAALYERHNDMLAQSVGDPFNSVFRQATWQPGILSREISEGPRLELPARGHVLFRGGIAEFVDPEWVLNVPWRDREAEAHGFDPSANSPSLAWPADRAWVLVTEVDFDSTIVGGSPALIAALCGDERLEAFPIPADADLHYNADRVNG